jgi:opacity protein-like surface antigen
VAGKYCLTSWPGQEIYYVRIFNMLKRISVVLLLLLCSSVALAQYDHPRKKDRSEFGSRDGRFEASVILSLQSGVDLSNDEGSSIDVDSSMGWGISFGWNWTAHLNLSYRLLVNKPSYLAIIVPDEENILPQEIDYKMSKYSHQVNATYNFMEGSFTPFLSGGLGWTKLDSNVPDGPPQTGCWWDPWYGYICFSDWQTYSTSKFSYNLGAGVRWDINNAIYSKAAYNREFLSLKTGSLNFDTVSVEVGMMF